MEFPHRQRPDRQNGLLLDTGEAVAIDSESHVLKINSESVHTLLIAYSQYGECEDTAHIVLPLAKESFWVPNAFTPDNPDGNNLFGSTSQQTLSQEMFIYNRRGELIFHCEEVDCKWDGRDLKGNPVPQDAYVYLIKYNNTYEPERTFIKRGTVTLIR